MIMTEEEQQVRKDFSSYLRKEENRHGLMLKSMMDALDNHIDTLLDIDIQIYDEKISIEDLLLFAEKLESEEMLAKPFGYICSVSINSYIKYIANKRGLDLNSLKNIPMEEGDKRYYSSTRYERDPLARKRCIEHYGCKCFVCGFDFEKVYGELGKGFIEVHHIVPISQRGGNYLVDPIRDLRPLCSNCHSMIHRNNETLSIDRLSKIVREMK